jgi:pimeloyl-ACP methyl ester carboxylesterase
MKYNAIQGTIMHNIRKYEVPLFFLTGAHDYTTPFPLIAAYYDSVTAPSKQLIWFDRSAHFRFYEEPQKFDSVLIHIVLKTCLPAEPGEGTNK